MPRAPFAIRAGSHNEWHRLSELRPAIVRPEA
jgi:hypothetical protein